MFPTISGNLLLARSNPRNCNYIGLWNGNGTFVFSHLSLTIRRSSLGAEGNFFRKRRGRDRQRPCPCRARESLAAFVLRCQHRGSLVCAPGHSLHCRDGTAPGDEASPCSRSPQAPSSRYGTSHGTASIQERLSRTKPVYMPRELTRRIHCSSAVHRSLGWSHQRSR